MFVASWPATVAVANMQLFTNVMPKHGKGMAGHGFRFHFDVSVSFHFVLGFIACPSPSMCCLQY